MVPTSPVGLLTGRFKWPWQYSKIESISGGREPAGGDCRLGSSARREEAARPDAGVLVS